eukprot:jgi/Bigna1/133377/aug1.21_g8085
MGDLSAYFENFPLTASLRPKLAEGEIEYCFGNHVRVYYRDELAHENGSCYLTSHKVAWLSNKRKQGSKLPVHMFAVRLPHVKSVEGRRNLFSSPKIVLHFNPQSSSSSSSSSSSDPYIKLSFRDGMRDNFLGHLKSALADKAWVADKGTSSAKKRGAAAEFKTTSAGIQGLIKMQKDQAQRAEKNVDEAFHDLDALMGKASVMVDLAKRCSEGMRVRSDTKKEEHDRFSLMLTDMGIPNPVTRSSAGSKYHEQLARQLADFFMQRRGASQETRLAEIGGIITLPDAYCLFNRARGTEMVSPNDLLDACQLLERLHLPLACRKFDSNVLVIQAKDHSDEKMMEKVVAHIKSSGAVSAIDLSRDLRLSLVLAKHHLSEAERSRLLCRDQSLDGIRFHINMFEEVALDTL